jgi:hypothetical protein
VLLDGVDGGATVVGQEHRVPVGLQIVPHELGDVLVVIGHEHRRCLLHVPILLGAGATCPPGYGLLRAC